MLEVKREAGQRLLSHGKFLLLLLLLLLLCTPLSPNLQAHISASRPISQPQGPNPSLEAQIPRGWDLGLEDGILALRWDLGLEVGIWASRLGFGPRGWDMGLEAEIWASRLGGGGYEEEEGGEGEEISAYVKA